MCHVDTFQVKCYQFLFIDPWFEITPDESGYSLSGVFVATVETAEPLTLGGGLVPEAQPHPYSLLCVEQQAVAAAPGDQLLDFLSVGTLIPISYEAHHSGVICKSSQLVP